MVLRQSGSGEKCLVRVEPFGKLLEPVVIMEDAGSRYLHFRLPLVSGRNNFTILPEEQRLALDFQRVQAELNPKVLSEAVYLFHQGGALPKSCGNCHDLEETETIDPVGLKKQISCGICHQNLINKGSRPHSTTVNQECLSCHQQGVKWRIGFPALSTKKLCIICHTGKGEWFRRRFIHGPLSLGGCSLCHDPHGEDYRYQLWAEGSLRLCIACHSNKDNLVREKDRLPYVHGIILGKGCVACHDPHASDQQFMLLKPINELCVGCHPRLNLKRGHPVAGHPLQGPKNPLHPNRKFSCVSCHDPHGSSHQYLLIETKLGGRLCRGCHKR